LQQSSRPDDLPRRGVAAALAITVCWLWSSAVCAHAQTAATFPEVPLGQPASSTHGWAYACMAAGVGLVGGSFLIAERADDTYQEYLDATNPQRIEELYDRTLFYDTLSRAALLSGEALVAAGLYLRFVRRPPQHRLSLALTSRRCIVTVRF
jgi:hypothetical protein